MANKGADNFGDDDFYDPHDDVYNENGEVSCSCNQNFMFLEILQT